MTYYYRPFSITPRGAPAGLLILIIALLDTLLKAGA